jgi:hypothetical protein
MPYQSFMNYFYDIQTKIMTNKLVKQENINIRPTVNPSDKWRGGILGEIEFKKGGKLRILEEVEINPTTDQVNVLEYSYGYFGKYKEDQNFFFRYEMDTSRSVKNGIKRKDHPEFHLHANDKDLRYMTHKTNLDEILGFIEVCFLNKKD